MEVCLFLFSSVGLNFVYICLCQITTLQLYRENPTTTALPMSKLGDSEKEKLVLQEEEASRHTWLVVRIQLL